MHVLRLNLHFDLLAKKSLPEALRELADFLETPTPENTRPSICEGNSYSAFRHNRSLGFRLTGEAAVCSLEEGSNWEVSMDGIAGHFHTFETLKNLRVK